MHTKACRVIVSELIRVVNNDSIAQCSMILERQPVKHPNDGDARGKLCTDLVVNVLFEYLT